MKNYYFKTGIDGKNAIQASVVYEKSAGGYCAAFNVGDRDGDLFGWHIDADYFRYYQRPQFRLIVPSGRRSAAKEQLAREMMEQNVEQYVRDFADAAEAAGAPKMKIEAA